MAITPLPTIQIIVAQNLTWEQFKELHKMAHYTALFDRDWENRVLWDDELEFVYLESAAEHDFKRLQRGAEIQMELPEAPDAD